MYSCPFCFESYGSIMCLKAHCKLKHSTKLHSFFRCREKFSTNLLSKMCSRTFSDIYSFLKHLSKIHSRNNNINDNMYCNNSNTVYETHSENNIIDNTCSSNNNTLNTVHDNNCMEEITDNLSLQSMHLLLASLIIAIILSILQLRNLQIKSRNLQLYLLQVYTLDRHYRVYFVRE